MSPYFYWMQISVSYLLSLGLIYLFATVKVVSTTPQRHPSTTVANSGSNTCFCLVNKANQHLRRYGRGSYQYTNYRFAVHQAYRSSIETGFFLHIYSVFSYRSPHASSHMYSHHRHDIDEEVSSVSLKKR